MVKYKASTLGSPDQMRVRVPSPAPINIEVIMARKLYSVKYEKVAQFVKSNRAEIKAHLSSNHFEYAKLFGNTLYELRIKNFIEQFKIEKDKSYALEVISFFKSSAHIEKLLSHIGLLYDNKTPKEIFYIFVYVLEHSKAEDIKDIFFYQSFLMLKVGFNDSVNINFIAKFSVVPH